MIFVLLFVVACFLAYSNGANDNFKGVATLFGSGTTNYGRAINWATLTTFLGSVTAIFLASSLVKNFSGKGLVPDALIQTPEFAVSIALGAGITVFLATKIGMPISTTHSLVGGLFGSGMVAVGSAFNFSLLGSTFIMPLIVSPLIAAVSSMIVYLLFRRLRTFFGIHKQMCICIGNEYEPAANNLNTLANPANSITSHKTIIIGKQQQCIERYQGAFLGIHAQNLLDVAHFLSAGVVSFARGLNDTPKLVGLLIVINSLSIEWGMVALAIAMAIGGAVKRQKSRGNR